MDIFQSSQRKKFSRVYNRYVDKIYRFVFLKVNSQEIAQDLTSETFLKWWRAFTKSQNKTWLNATMPQRQTRRQNPGPENQIRNHQAFLYKIARNLVIDYYRERGRVRMVSLENEEIIDPSSNLEEKAVLGSDLDTIRQALSSLKQDHQDVIIWHYLDGLSFREISEVLSKPEGTIRVILHRALKELRETIDNKQ